MNNFSIAIVGLALSFSSPVVAQDTEPSSLSETYDSWTVQCQAVNEKRLCQMQQELRQANTNQRVLFTAITRSGDSDDMKGTFVAPFGLALADGFTLEAEEGQVLTAPFKTCLPAGCLVEADLSPKVVARLAGYDKVVAVMAAADTGQAVRTDIDLKGFTAAYNRLIGLSN